MRGKKIKTEKGEKGGGEGLRWKCGGRTKAKKRIKEQ